LKISSRFADQYAVVVAPNQWQGRNLSKPGPILSRDSDAVEAGDVLKLNDLVVGDNYILPLLRRPKVAAVSASFDPFPQRLGQ